jgi:hypothetical protein
LPKLDTKTAGPPVKGAGKRGWDGLTAPPAGGAAVQVTSTEPVEGVGLREPEPSEGGGHQVGPGIGGGKQPRHVGAELVAYSEAAGDEGRLGGEDVVAGLGLEDLAVRCREGGAGGAHRDVVESVQFVPEVAALGF